ncbi:MAG: ATP-binding protein [Candidatus Hydrogenedentota bacterium]
MNGQCERQVARECLEREQRAAERRIRAAKFPVVKTLDTFDLTAQPGINKALVVDLMRGDYLDRHENILLVGNPGTRKTHIATALGHAACASTPPPNSLPATRSPRRTPIAAHARPPRQTPPSHPRRTRLRALPQGRRRAALQRREPCL